MRKILFAAGAAATLAVSSMAFIPSAGAVTSGFTGVTTVTNRDDSGAHGNNWAVDAFTSTLRLFGAGIVANSHCPGITIGACHEIKGTITDHSTLAQAATFTTVVGQVVPGFGDLNGEDTSAVTMGSAVTGSMHGTLPYDFYTNAPISAFNQSNGASSVSGDSPSTGQWPEQFAPPGTQFWDTSGNTGGNEYLGTSVFSFTYTAPLKSDSACPNYSGQWVDADSTNSGSDPSAGNILAPDAAHC